MELTFLGTAAAEQYPGIWCTCDYCTRARQLGGKNIRKTSSIHFAENCLIDFPPDGTGADVAELPAGDAADAA